MSLTVVSVPIGHPKDITLRALDTLKAADAIICEEIRPAQTQLKSWGIVDKTLHPLNEHSSLSDVNELLELCRTGKLALISDAGTPGFCDPGAKLVARCREEGITVDVNPGASSLMALIALSGVELKEFVFVGFLPAEKTERKEKLKTLSNDKRPLVIMDTPYRLKSTIEELAEVWPERKATLGVDLTTSDQKVLVDKLKNLAAGPLAKAPFVVLLWGR